VVSGPRRVHRPTPSPHPAARVSPRGIPKCYVADGAPGRPATGRELIGPAGAGHGLAGMVGLIG
jgi:hypothetical protein